jgi:hypothetical protein
MSYEINYFFAVANILFFISVFPSLATFWKNRNVMKGFSLSGSFITVIGLLFVYAGYLSYGLYINTLLGLPLISFWIVVTFFCFKDSQRRKNLV